jgi:sulfur oxygenase/reductase
MDLKALFDAEPASPMHVAINRVLVRNDPNLMRMMKEASSKMCLATALTPGFRGFDLMRQRGTCPMGMRWGASTDMGEELSHIWIDQFTYWDSWEAHEDFHETFEDVVVEACGKCGGMLLDGPIEPVFRIVKSRLPKLVSRNQLMHMAFSNPEKINGYGMDTGKTVMVLAEHQVVAGKEAEFEAGEIETMEMLMSSPGVMGFQILKRIGLSTLGSGHATSRSMLGELTGQSGSKRERSAEVWEGYTIPAEYLVMIEFEDMQFAQGSMPHVNVKPEILRVHGPKVLDNCLTKPTVRTSETMFREHTYREILQGVK